MTNPDLRQAVYDNWKAEQELKSVTSTKLDKLHDEMLKTDIEIMKFYKEVVG